MGLINQAGMYNSVPTLNPLPYVNIALQARQRRQAREDALNNYYNKLPDTLNDKGIRDAEIPIINDYKSKIMEFGVKNRDALKNPKVDNGAAQLALQKLMRDAAGVARMSQNAAKADLEAGKFFLNKDNAYALNNDAYLNEHHASTLPVTDPNYKQLDLQKYATNRPFDEMTFVKDIKGKIPYSEKVVREPDPTDPNYEIVTTLPVLDAKAKEMMVTDAADRFHNDPLFRKKIEKDLAGTGQIPNLVQIAKDQFGVTDPTEMSDELLAAAYTYSKLPVGKTKEKVQANYTNREAGKIAAAKDKAYLNDALIRGRMKLNQSYKMAMKDYTAGVDAAQDVKVLNTFIENTIANGSNGSATLAGVKYDGTITDLPKDISKKYVATVTDPNDSKYTIEKEPDRWLFTSDGKNVIPLYYEKDANKQGKGALISNPNQKPISIQNIKTDLAKLLLGQKQRGGEVIDQFDIEETPTQPAKQSSKATPAKTKTVTVTSSKQTIPGF